jgi:small subunit ribosomal protein S6
VVPGFSMPAVATPTYDLMLLLSTEVPEERRSEILSRVEDTIGKGDGSLVSRHDWGVRNLAYEIRHRADAEYHLLQFTGSPALLETLGHDLRITDGVTRYRIIKLREGTPPPPEATEEHVGVTAVPDEAPEPE